ncbi:hypothetical protein [Paraburkholderia adhaesiva]|uniref:hypothetical protein n=1 Tax=Paraburkholderia adhaesiva TaxID=2883244 RepID=UPI001F329262|nr:hypothetical protein [Paraburkholderia adhaesiva]
MDQLLEMQEMSAQQRLPGGHRTFWVNQRGKFAAKSGQIPADSLRRALRRERRAENRFSSSFSVVLTRYQGQIVASTAK